MTPKEQVKILDNKIKANNAQYELDRMNAEISAYSSGDLPKYEYLTKKDLGYKPDAFEQAKFEYSPLGKVFTDGLDKSDKNEGLLKRLKNIDEYKTIQDYKQELIDKNILKLSGIKKFDDIVDKWKQTKNKKIASKNAGDKVGTQKYLNEEIDYRRINMIKKSINDGIKIYKKSPLTDRKKRIIDNSNKIIRGINLFISMIDNDEFKISKKYYTRPNDNVNLDWMNDKIGYEETAEEADSVYMKKK